MALTTTDSDIWPQRLKFKARLAAFQKKNKRTQEQVASDLGISLNGLRQVLYQKGRRPGLTTIKAAAFLFGCSITEFLDDPGAPLQGVPFGTSEDERVILRQIAEDLTILNPSQRRYAIAAWSAMIQLVQTPCSVSGTERTR